MCSDSLCTRHSWFLPSWSPSTRVTTSTRQRAPSSRPSMPGERFRHTFTGDYLSSVISWSLIPIGGPYPWRPYGDRNFDICKKIFLMHLLEFFIFSINPHNNEMNFGTNVPLRTKSYKLTLKESEFPFLFSIGWLKDLIAAISCLATWWTGTPVATQTA